MHAVRFLPSRCRSPNSAPSQAFPPFLGLSHFLLFSHIKSLVIIGTETQLFDEFKFARSEANTIAANDNDYMTSIPGIFAAGDARRGQSLVVWAIADGRGAAAAIDKYLTAVK